MLALFHLDNAGVIVNNKGEMKGKHFEFLLKYGDSLKIIITDRLMVRNL